MSSFSPMHLTRLQCIALRRTSASKLFEIFDFISIPIVSSSLKNRICQEFIQLSISIMRFAPQ